MGSVHKVELPSGKLRWQARYRDLAGRQRSRNFGKEGEATAFVQAVETDKRRGEWIDPRGGRVGFATYAEQWQEGRRGLRESTRLHDEGLIRNHIIPHFGKTPLVAIDRTGVQKFVTLLVKDSGLSPSTIRVCYRLLRAIMAAGVEDKLIPQNPCRGISLPRVKRKKERHLTVAEIDTLAAAVPDHYRALIYTAAYTGMRWGELVGLKRKHLDLARRRIRIVGSLEDVQGKVTYVSETKTETSRRTLTLPRFLAEILEKHLASAPASEYVFTTRDGKLLRRTNFRKRVLLPALDKAGMEHLTFHDLRHTAAALMVERGAHPLTIKERLGHKDIRTTLNVYGHLYESVDKGVTESLDELYESTRKPLSEG